MAILILISTTENFFVTYAIRPLSGGCVNENCSDCVIPDTPGSIRRNCCDSPTCGNNKIPFGGY